MSTRELSIDALRADEGSSGDGVEDGGVGVLVGLWGDVVHYVVLQDIQVVAKRIKVALQGVDVSLHRRAVGLVGERRCPRSFVGFCLKRSFYRCLVCLCV